MGKLVKFPSNIAHYILAKILKAIPASAFIIYTTFCYIISASNVNFSAFERSFSNAISRLRLDDTILGQI